MLAQIFGENQINKRYFRFQRPNISLENTREIENSNK